jgi:hypothetical protein
LKGLHASCDAEAVRVISSCKIQWKPALKNGKGANQKFILPVTFALTDGPPHPLHSINRPIKTVVIKKTVTSKDSTACSLYSDAGTSIKSGSVPVGDSVVVMGWAPWAYYVQTSTATGYISWKALMLTDELKQLSEIVEEHSQKEYDDSFYAPYGNPNAMLSLTIDKQSVYTGQCAAVTISFDLHPQNGIPLHFYELGKQLQEIPGTLPMDNCYIFNSGLNDVKEDGKLVNGVRYSSYPVYKANYCPITPKPIVFPTIKLIVAKSRPHPDDADSLITFATKPQTITVNPLSAGATVSSFDGFPLTGNYNLTDSLMADKIIVDKPVIYRVTIKGEGMTFPMTPPQLNIENATIKLHDIIDTEHWTDAEPETSKTFLYQVTFGKPGVYDLRGKIRISYFEVTSKKAVALESRAVAHVLPSERQEVPQGVNSAESKNHFIAIDVSQSMACEDYTPNRLSAVKNGLKQFLNSRENCDVGLIAFAARAKHLNVSSRSCFEEGLVDSLEFKMYGTAIGDAILLAKNLFSKNEGPKKLIIIGDGDNNAGHLSPKLAATIAKKYNMMIYTIGVGTTGLVPLGRDVTGKPNLYPNTFSDKDFKMISSLTGGQYFWAKDANEVSRILKMILIDE